MSYYQQEEQEHGEQGKRKFTAQEAEMVVKKLYHHYKLGEPCIAFTSGCRSSRCGGHNITLNIDRLNASLIAHEVAHAVQYKKGFIKTKRVYHDADYPLGSCALPHYHNEDGRMYHQIRIQRHAHGKWHRGISNRILHYIVKKNYFSEELARRTAPKLPKPEPTKMELKAKELEHLKVRIKRYQTKVKFYSNKLHRAEISLRRKENNFKALQPSR